MVRYRLGLIVIVSIIAAACHHSKKPFMFRLEECTLQKESSYFKEHFYPFEENEFDKKSFLQYFDSSVQIDSGFNTKSNGDSVKFYRFHNNDSRMIFSLNNYSIGEKDFDIAIFEINSYFLKFKNDLQVDMSRAEFFKILEIKETDCDTFDIIEPTGGCYYRFTFTEDILKAILKEYIH
jgi:hypothetical protein